MIHSLSRCQAVKSQNIERYRRFRMQSGNNSGNEFENPRRSYRLHSDSKVRTARHNQGVNGSLFGKNWDSSLQMNDRQPCSMWTIHPLNQEHNHVFISLSSKPNNRSFVSDMNLPFWPIIKEENPVEVWKLTLKIKYLQTFSFVSFLNALG
jgi:hypothetical protein